MFCKNCGAQLGSDTRFCPHCGSAQSAVPPMESAPPAQPTPPMPFADKVRATAKKVGSSPLFLAAVICFTLVQVPGLLSLFSADSFWDVFSDSFAEGEPNLWEYLTLVFDLIGTVPGILIAIGLWITYGSCASRKPKVTTAGLTTIFVVKLVQLVLSCLALLVALFPMILLYAKIDTLPLYGADKDLLPLVLPVFIVILLVAFVLILLYFIKVCTSISNVRSTLKTGVPNKRVSRFVAIMSYIDSSLMIISGMQSLLSAGVATLDGFYDESLFYVLPSTLFLSGISGLLNAATMILFGTLIFSYRGKMKALEAEERILAFQTLSYAEPYTSPVYIPPQPVAEPEDLTEPEEIPEPAPQEETD